MSLRLNGPSPVVRTPDGSVASANPYALAASPSGLWLAGDDAK